MCRLFAQISTQPRDALDLLVDSEFSLLKQSDFKKSNKQEDGWGIAHFGNQDQVLVSKSPGPAFKEKEPFKDAAQKANSRVIIGHIRAASNPRKLPRSKLINMDNTQPFSDGRWIFAHNGTLEIPLEVAERLGPLQREIRSHNDSEVYFWHFIKHERRHGDVRRALAAAIEEIWEIWEKGARARHPEKRTPYTSLNTLVSDGRSVHGLCHSARRGLSERGVCNPDQSWQIMSWRQEGNCRVVIASENLDRGPWNRLADQELLSAELGRNGLIVERQRLGVSIPKNEVAQP
ncbi:MAG: class II glutamine amidotransferase [Elusimicrobia bacterium]|nr:class II glutamine amidotransferase [Elusimicrobiota bacterium]